MTASLRLKFRSWDPNNDSRFLEPKISTEKYPRMICTKLRILYIYALHDAVSDRNPLERVLEEHASSRQRSSSCMLV